MAASPLSRPTQGIVVALAIGKARHRINEILAGLTGKTRRRLTGQHTAEEIHLMASLASKDRIRWGFHCPAMFCI
jgi:hypothetical protein